jgi:hypothetical protein
MTWASVVAERGVARKAINGGARMRILKTAEAVRA